MTTIKTGLSGLSLYLPPYRVDLQQWCEWTGQDWEKIRRVVGTGFRLPGPQQGVYTMAANAVLRLIRQYNVDPTRVRYLALGTESSTDNSAGAVIVRGMVDSALSSLNLPRLSRNCEVPEFKHACLGGVYGIKNALRFLHTDGDDSLAIVVCADKALYARGSSGEPTQGAGAVALLLDKNPTIASIDLRRSGTASEYRSVDFRKPLINRNGTASSPDFVDIPIFNGKYSTSCYVDEMQRALEDMYRKCGTSGIEKLRSLKAVFMHRPYQRMPEKGLGMAYLFALANGSKDDLSSLASYCDDAGESLAAFLKEAQSTPDFPDYAVSERISDEIFPVGLNVMKAFRKSEEFSQQVRAKIELGTDAMLELGNLYTAALPAWLAAGLNEAAERNIELAGSEMLLVGYGSGDAADTIPMQIEPGWKAATKAIEFVNAMSPSISVTHEQYLALRNPQSKCSVDYQPKAEFVIDRVGKENNARFQDAGIEYYRYVQ